MPHDRLMPFEAVPLAAAPTAGAVRCGARVFLSGYSALRPDGSVAELGDPAVQAHAALDRIEAALHAAGGRCLISRS